MIQTRQLNLLLYTNLLKSQLEASAQQRKPSTKEQTEPKEWEKIFANHTQKGVNIQNTHGNHTTQ